MVARMLDMTGSATAAASWREMCGIGCPIVVSSVNVLDT